MTLDEAKLILKDSISEDNGLYNLDWYLGYNPGKDWATLDGAFTADALEAIAVYMRASQKVQA